MLYMAVSIALLGGVLAIAICVIVRQHRALEKLDARLASYDVELDPVDITFHNYDLHDGFAGDWEEIYTRRTVIRHPKTDRPDGAEIRTADGT